MIRKISSRLPLGFLLSDDANSLRIPLVTLGKVQSFAGQRMNVSPPISIVTRTWELQICGRTFSLPPIHALLHSKWEKVERTGTLQPNSHESLGLIFSKLVYEYWGCIIFRGECTYKKILKLKQNVCFRCRHKPSRLFFFSVVNFPTGNFPPVHTHNKRILFSSSSSNN